MYVGVVSVSIASTLVYVFLYPILWCSQAAAGATYCSFLDTFKELSIDSKGYGVFPVQPNSVDVWVDVRCV